MLLPIFVVVLSVVVPICVHSVMRSVILPVALLMPTLMIVFLFFLPSLVFIVFLLCLFFLLSLSLLLFLALLLLLPLLLHLLLLFGLCAYYAIAVVVIDVGVVGFVGWVVLTDVGVRICVCVVLRIRCTLLSRGCLL